jgi:hypothetical protein
MQPMRARDRFGSGAGVGAGSAPQQSTLASRQAEWADADAVDRLEAAQAARRWTRSRLVLVVLLAIAAAAIAAVFPLTPGFAASDTAAAVAAAAIAAVVTVAVVFVADHIGRMLVRSGAGEVLVFTAAAASVAAAAVHFAVAKMHFDEYALFGVFFVLSGIAQLVWPVWLLLRRWPPLLALGAIGNAAIVALWAVDRIWGLPLGPTPWKPDPFGFGDTVASGFEVLLVICCLEVLVRGRGRTLRRPTKAAITVAVAALTTLALLSVLGVGASVLTPSE